MSNTPKQLSARASMGVLAGLVLAVLLAIGSAIGWRDVVKGLRSPNQKGVTTDKPVSRSKAEWKKKYTERFGRSFIGIPAIQLKQVFGEPDKTQTVGNQAYWYYDCSDGMIQVILPDPRIMGNSALIEGINDY
jgi:hypothetical protein